jgi:hypothetical protein
MAETSNEELERSRRETRSAFENRALMYFYIFDELSAEVGREKAAEVMKRAIRRRGVEVGAKYAPAAVAGDLEEVGRIFCGDSPCQGELFHPAVEEPAEEGRIVLSMQTCPLMDAWKGLGLDPEETDLLCQISAAVDEGTFEGGAGLELTFLDRLGRPGAEKCVLELKAAGGGTD